MLVDTFKYSKKAELIKPISAYVTKHFDMIAVKEVEDFSVELENSRNAAISCIEVDKSGESMKKAKDNIILYLRLLHSFKQKLNFGNDQFSIKVSFVWGDVLNKDNYTSFQYAHEYYNQLFNLAICLVNFGKSVSRSDSDEKIKEAIQSFNFAAWIFDKIKQELPGQIAQKDIQPDLSTGYLTYAGLFTLANSQVLIMEISERKKMSLELQAQLTKGVYDLLTSATTFTNEALKKYSNEALRGYFTNRKFYYLAKGLLKMREFQAEELKRIGKGYGKMIAYTQLANEALSNADHNLKNYEKMIDAKEYLTFRKQVDDDLRDMKDKNSRIYLDRVPPASELPKIEKKLMANPKILPEDLTKKLDICARLDNLIPHEVKPMIESYKSKIGEFITSRLQNLQNEGKIVCWLSNLGLPSSLESVLSQKGLSDSLWKRINETQQKGGSMYLSNSLENIDKMREIIGKRLNDINVVLLNEEQEDAKYRNLYSSQWTREPSNKLNYQYLGFVNQYKSKLEIARNCDEGIKTQILDNMKYFDILSLTKEGIERKIPVKTDINILETMPEAKYLRDELDKLEVLKDKNIEAVESLFRNLNEENLVPQMLEVHKKKTSEMAVFNQNLPKYEEMLKEVENLDPQITNCMKEVEAKNKVFLAVKNEKIKPNPENEKFFRDLESFCQLYHEKLTNVNQGLNFYNEFNSRIDQLNNHVTDYLLSRDIEKNELIKMVMSGGGGRQFATPGGNSNPNYFDFTQKQPNQGKWFLLSDLHGSELE